VPLLSWPDIGEQTGDGYGCCGRCICVDVLGDGCVAQAPWESGRDQEFSANAERCLTSSLSSAPIGLWPSAPLTPPSACSFLVGLRRCIVVSLAVLLRSVVVVFVKVRVWRKQDVV